MPGRVSERRSVRSVRSSAAISRKSSTQTLKSRASNPTRTSSPAVDIPDEGPTTSLRAQLCSVFADAQRSTALHRKLVITLRKIQEACCYEPVNPRKQVREESFEEDDFNNEFGRCAIRILAVKKSELVGDRMVRFLGLFLKHATEKDSAIAQPDTGTDATESFPETPSTRLTSHVVSIVLPLLHAKDKVVRFRSAQVVAHLINTLDSVDDEVFQHIRMGLLKRLRDKEPTVRVQAVYGLGRIAFEADEDTEDEDSDDDSAGGVLEKLLDVLQHDPSADVRRCILQNLQFTTTTLPYLLERARDVDAGTRRVLYSRILPALGDFRHMSLTHREKLLRWGLRDRDENVRKATARVFRERWIEYCAGEPEATEDGAAAPRAVQPSLDALLELLERIDVVNSGVEGGITLEAMREFWEGRPDYREYITFEDVFWAELTPESIFVARTFNDFCRSGDAGKLQGMVEDKMPEVTKFAFLLERQINMLLESVKAIAMQGNEGAEDDSVQQEFVVEQMLHVALTLDYSDEVGRRKMFSLMREVLALADLPEESTKLVIEVLRTVCGGNAAGEREFCGIVLEAVAEVHDIIMGDDNTERGDESFHSARSEISGESTPKKAQVMKKSKRTAGEEVEDSAMEDEKAVREIMVNMKCLHIAQCMLQNVQCNLEENVHLVTMLNNLVVPAVRSQEAPIRERGLLCLGLCCLLGKNLAEENLTLFLHCFAKGHPALQAISIQIICDILTTHPTLLSPPPMPTNADQTEIEANPLQKPVHKMFAKALKSPEGDVQLAGCTALCKLMLTNIIKDTDLLKQLVVAYFEPDTQGNVGLRQALSYFLPVYCHSRTENAERMVAVAVSVVHSLANMSEELDEEEEMVGMGVVAAHLVDWTDPRRVIGAAGALGTVTGKEKEVGGEVHLSLAEELLEKVLTPGTSKEEKKIFISMLGKLYISPTCVPARLRTIFDLVNEVFENKIATDATSRNVFTGLQASLSKCITETRAQEGSEKEAGDTVAPTAELNNDDGVTAQLQTELDADATRVEEPDAEGTVMGDDDAPTEVGDGEIDMDMSGLAPDSAIQDLLDSFGDEDDPDLM